MESMEQEQNKGQKPVSQREYADDIERYMEKFESLKRVLGSLSLRRYMWDVFSAITAKHIEEYSVPQYKDYPDDQLTSWSAQDCVKQVMKYANRLESNARGDDEVLSDLVKIAHYASVAYMKLRDYEGLFVVPPHDAETGEPIPPVATEVIDADVEVKDGAATTASPV